MTGTRKAIALTALSAVLWCASVAASRRAPRQEAEPPAPEPASAVQDLIERVNQLGQAKRQSEALDTLGQALQVARRLGDLIGEAEVLRGRAIYLERLGQPREAERAWQDAASAWERAGQAPERIEALLRRALLASGTRAEEVNSLLAQALTLSRAEPRRPRAAATVLNEAGGDWYRRRQFERAHDLWMAALEIRDRLSDQSPDTAAVLNNLGAFSEEFGNLAAAREFYQRALSILQARQPESPAMAAALNNAGDVEQGLNNLEAAYGYYDRARALQERRSPGSLPLAATLDNLGALAQRAGGPEIAEGFYRRALEIQEREEGGVYGMARTLNNLGAVAGDRQQLPQARDYFGRALLLFEKHFPESPEVAATLHNLAVTSAKLGHTEEAEREARRAWELVRRQAGLLAGDENRLAFNASTSFYSAFLIRCQLALGKQSEAFATLEEARALALQRLLAERPALLELAGGRIWSELEAASAEEHQSAETLRRARRALENAAGLLSALKHQPGAHDLSESETELASRGREFDDAQAAYLRARGRAEALAEEARRSAPRVFAPPVTADGALEALPPGALFVAFSVGGEETAVFLVESARTGSARAAITTRTLKLGADELLALVSRFRATLANQLSDVEDVEGQSRDLFKKLFPGELGPKLAAARRLLISPDGPLWELPFAALAREGAGRAEYLGESRPIAYTQSLAVFKLGRGEGPRLGRGRKPWALVVGDPAMPAPPIATAGALSNFLVNGRPPERLARAREEALAVSRLYDGELLTDERAQEAALRRVAGRADIIHLATHGRLDPLDAMSSGLLLAPSGAGGTDEDGVLQAWEIFSQLKLRAELVVMSACESGRGENATGEGIVGLTRAWQYAGARSVVASHWRVDDRGAAALMISFHEGLAHGLAKDEALMRAMREVRRDPRTAHPFFWAPFFLVGQPDPILEGRRE